MTKPTRRSSHPNAFPRNEQHSGKANHISEPISERPWWHTMHVNKVRAQIRQLPLSEVIYLAEEMKGAIKTLAEQKNTASPEFVQLRVITKDLGPSVAFDANRFAQAIAERHQISLEEAHELVEEYDWWKSVCGALSYTEQKHAIAVGEIARRRANGAEQAVFDIKSKVVKVCDLLERVEREDLEEIEESFRLMIAIKERLADVGP